MLQHSGENLGTPKAEYVTILSKPRPGGLKKAHVLHQCVIAGWPPNWFAAQELESSLVGVLCPVGHLQSENIEQLREPLLRSLWTGSIRPRILKLATSLVCT